VGTFLKIENLRKHKKQIKVYEGLQQHDIGAAQEHEKTNQLTITNKRTKNCASPLESDEGNNMPLKKGKRHKQARK